MKQFLLSFFLGTALTAGPITTIDVPGATLINLEGISNNGVAVGYYFDGTKGHGFEVLADGTLVYPSDDPSASGSTGFGGINNSGTVVGNASDLGPGYGFTFSSGAFTDFPAGCTATGINDAGTVIGSCLPGSTDQAFFQTAGGPLIYLNPPGAQQSIALGINDLGQIVGQEQIGGVYYAFIRNADGSYQTITSLFAINAMNDEGVMIANGGNYYGTLGNLVQFSLPGAQFSGLSGINDAGEAVGTYTNNGVEHGFIEFIVPEPSTFILAGIGLFVSLGIRVNSERRSQGKNRGR
jgi:hypothetical protein